MTDPSSRQRERPTSRNRQLPDGNKDLVLSPRWVLYSKTDWPTDRRSEHNFVFDFDTSATFVKRFATKKLVRIIFSKLASKTMTWRSTENVQTIFELLPCSVEHVRFNCRDHIPDTGLRVIKSVNWFSEHIALDITVSRKRHCQSIIALSLGGCLLNCVP
jgi:hypothetical protein